MIRGKQGSCHLELCTSGQCWLSQTCILWMVDLACQHKSSKDESCEAGAKMAAEGLPMVAYEYRSWRSTPLRPGPRPQAPRMARMG